MVGVDDAVAWHDVECGSYSADLPLWRELADAAGGPVLDLGCGTGRVALDLVERGHTVAGVDSDPALVTALRARRPPGAALEASVGDVRGLSLGRRFSLAIAPMQVFQLLGRAEGRGRALRAVHEHLEPCALLAVALADPFEAVPAEESLPPLPDVRERDGWVLSSAPVAVRPEQGGVAIDRVRQAVSPAGELTETFTSIVLDELSPEMLEREGAEAGLRAAGRRRVPPTADHVGSTVVLLEAP